MSRPAQKFVALAAAVCYGVLAVASHGLHDWIGCADEHCGGGSQVVAQASTGCCHDCGHDAAAPTPERGAAHEQSFRGYAAGHDAANCSVCAFVAKLKTSVVTHGSAPLVTQTIEPAADAAPAFFSNATPRTHDTRGPPALRA